MYADDILENLVSLVERQNEEFFPDIIQHLKGEGDGGGGTGNTSLGGADLESIVSSVNGVDTEKAKALGEVFKVISNSEITQSFVDNSSKLSKTIDGLANAINKTQVNKEKLEEVQMLAAGASALIAISRSLTFAAPFLMIGAVMSFALIPIAWAVSKAFSFLDKDTIKKMDDGGDALKSVGWSLIIFSGGIAIATALIGNAVLNNPVALLSLFAVIGLSALTFGLVGKFSEYITDGAWAVAGMGLSLMLFSFSMKVASGFVEEVGMMNMLKLGLVLAGTAFIYGLAGKFATDILWGALAFAGIGLSLMLLASPLETIADTMSKNAHVLWQLPVMLTGLGVVYGIAGLATPLILAGALSFAAIGGSLILIAAGLKAMEDAGKLDGDVMKDTISKMVEAFTEISLGDMIMIPLKLPAILSIAAALSLIGYGMGVYKEQAGWTEEDADQFGYTIKTFAEAFGNEDIDWGQAEEGIDATWYMGQNLNRLAKGIAAWEDIDFDIEKVQENIISILTSMPMIFADIGRINQNSKPSGLFGTWFQKGDVEEGIDATMKMGKNLKNLAEGIAAWEEIDFDLTAVKTNIQDILSTIPFIFADVGRMNKGGKPSGMWESVFGSDDVAGGVEATKDMGKTLVDLAKGISAWETIEFDLTTVSRNVRNVLGVIPKVFAKVGREAKKSEGWFSDSDHVKGAEVVKGFSAPLKAIASLVETFNQSDVNPKKIKHTIYTVFKAVGQVHKLVPQKASNRLHNLGGAMKKVGKEFPKFNKGLKDFQEILSKISADTIDSFLSITEAIENLAKIKYIDVNVKKGKLNSIAGEIVKEASEKKGKSKEQIIKDKANADKKANEGKDIQQIIAEKLSEISSHLETVASVGSDSEEHLEKIKKQLTTGTIRTSQ